MEKRLKKIKNNVYPHVLFGNSVITVQILLHLPPISVLAMFKLFPHILIKKWTTIGHFIDNIYAQIKKKVHPDFFHNNWIYTGSMLLEVLLGETFTNGKRDVDILDNNDSYLTTSSKFIQAPVDVYGHQYCLKNKPNEIIDVLDVFEKGETRFKKRVNHFDINCCKNYITPTQIYIAHPFDLLSKNTKLEFDNILYDLTPFSIIYKIQITCNDIAMRLDKYTTRGFKIEVVNTFTSLQQFKNYLKNNCPNETFDNEFIDRCYKIIIEYNINNGIHKKLIK